MAVPKKKLSKSRRGMRRSHDAIAAVNTITCSYCGQPNIPHNVCRFCGKYAKKIVKTAGTK